MYYIYHSEAECEREKKTDYLQAICLYKIHIKPILDIKNAYLRG